MSEQALERRTFLKSAAGTALTTSLFTGRVRGANERIRTGFIGPGRMGRSSLGIALKAPEIEVTGLCDIYKPNLELAMKMAPEAKVYKDFREVLAAKDIDAVNISTPDHWHAYMAVEACKAGKDVCLHFAHYNLCRIHQTIRVTPAMESGLTDYVWTIAELLG